MKKLHERLQVVKENTSLGYILFAISIGGFLSLYIVNYLNFVVLPFYEKGLTEQKSKFEIFASKLSKSYIIVFSISLLISIIALILIPLAIKGINSYDKVIGISACILVILLFVEFIISISTNKITEQFIFILWGFLFILILQIERISKTIYKWLQKDTKKDFDIAKLTFVWGVIATILTLLNKK